LEKNLDSFRNVTVALNPEVFEETPTNNWVARGSYLDILLVGACVQGNCDKNGVFFR